MARLKLNPREIMMIVSLLICLFAVLALRTTCAEGVAKLFEAMEPPPGRDGGPAPDSAAVRQNH